jgi:AcrR family transcriptional regulator
MKTRDRILASAIDQITDFGVRRFTIDDLARRVGLSRVTIYRHFPSRDEVLQAALLQELHSFRDEVDRAVLGYDTREQRVVEAFVFAVSALRQHRALGRLLRTEPEIMLPLLTTSGGPVLAAGREHLSTLTGDDVLAETIARLVMSFALTPASVTPLDTEAELREFAERYIAAMVRVSSDAVALDELAADHHALDL